MLLKKRINYCIYFGSSTEFNNVKFQKTSDSFLCCLIYDNCSSALNTHTVLVTGLLPILQLPGNFGNTEYQHKSQSVYRRSKTYVNIFQNEDKYILKITFSITGFQYLSGFYLKSQMRKKHFV